MSTTNEQGQCNLALRTKRRRDTYRIRASAALNEVDDGKLIAVDIGATPIVLTLASAVTCVGCIIEGVVATSTGESSLSITSATPAQLQFTGAPGLTSSTNTLSGAALVLANVAVGVRFRAVSTGARWHVVVHNPAARPFLGVRAINADTTLTINDANHILPITITAPSVTVTLPNANAMPGAVVRGVIVANPNSLPFTVTCVTVGQIVANTVLLPTNGTPDLGDTVNSFSGGAVVFAKPAVGTSFEAVSTGTIWSVRASGVITTN